MEGEGASGCVVRPAVPCYGSTRAYDVPVVSKLYSNVRDRDIDKLHYEEFVRLADPNAEASVPILDSCITRGIPSRAEACAVVRNNHRDPFMYQNIMPAAGVPLNRGARLVRSGEAMMALVAPLFRFVARLDRKHLSHFDIKPGNVLYDAESGRVRVIDYGLVRPQADVYLAGRAWERYRYYPPELYVLTAIRNGSGIYNAAEVGRHQLVTYPAHFPAWHRLFPDSEADYNTFLLRLKADSLLWPPDIANRIDVFGAGACLAEVWPHLRWRSAANEAAAAAFARALLRADPRERMTPAAALKAHAALVERVGGHAPPPTAGRKKRAP